MGDDDRPRELLETGRNCWRIERAERIGILNGGEAYFRAARQALLAAEKRACLLAWDLHSGIEMVRGDEEPSDGLPRELGAFLNALLERKADLHLHLLVWDFSLIYAAEREWRLFSDALRDPHPRLHLHFDDQLPIGASHHQKVLVIDDALAFLGGLDLSAWRWDSAEHRLDDTRRTDPNDEPYGPYHDIQAAVTGPAARALGDLCAERWERATGEPLPRVGDIGRAPWPEEIEVVFEEVDIALARTFAAFEPWPEILEIEHLHLDAIAAAERYLYFENQYFSSRRLTEALVERLREPDGPEIVIVLNRSADWLAEGTMSLLRDRWFEVLSAADDHDRLRIYFPRVADEEGDESEQVYVHAKTFIMDDRVLKIGSSNLSNRSLRVDSEIDLVIEQAGPDERIREVLHRWIAGHFQEPPERIARQIEESGGLGKAIEALVRDTGHSLRAFPIGCEGPIKRRLAETGLLDPDEPPDPEYWIRRAVPQEERPSILRRLVKVVGLLVAGLVLVLLANYGWGEVLDRETVIGWLESLRANPWAPAILVGAFTAGGIVGISLNLLLIAATIALGPWIALGCGFVGAYLSALAGYGVGHVAGRPLLARFAPEKRQRLDQFLRRRGMLSVVLVRLLPVAPFPVVNVAAGASPLALRTFLIGTLLGMAPGMAAVVFLTDRFNAAVTEPGWENFAILGLVLALVGGAVFFLRHALGSRGSSAGGKGS